MPAIRLIPKSEDAPFPYWAAYELLQGLPGAAIRPKDFGPLIAAAIRLRWTSAMIRSHEEMAARAMCFDFYWKGPPKLSGTLYEDNVFFSVVDDEVSTMQLLRSWANKLDVRVFQH